MKEFDFDTPVYKYDMRFEDPDEKILYYSEVLLVSEPHLYIESKKQSSEESINKRFFYVTRFSLNPNDRELIDEMRNIMLSFYNQYIEHLNSDIEKEKKIRDGFFKTELRLLKIKNILDDDEDIGDEDENIQSKDN